MRRFLLIITALFLDIYSGSAAEKIALENFIVRENLLKNDKIAVIAADKAEKPVELNGKYTFTINGFKQELRFNEGVAVIAQPVEKSTFIYLKHEMDASRLNKLYYIYKSNDSLNPIKINLKLLILIPLIIISVISFFRKFLVFGLLVLAGWIYFNSSNGLSLPTYFETVFDALRALF